MRLTITDNHFERRRGGERGPRRLGEVKFLGSDLPLVNASAGATYSYTTLPTFSGGTFYLDDPHPGYATAGDYGVGDLNDGVTHPNGSAPTTGPVNSIVGWGDPASIATDITFDLGDTFYVPEQIVLGSHLWAAFANGAPDSVTVRSSMDGSIFTDLTTATLGAPAGDGHWDLAVPIEGASAARFVQLSFDGGAVLTGNTPNKWMLDEITILASVPEPSRAMLLLLGVAGFALRRRR
ncbi:MAG: PEP-CTERM sorting domain-containing protein [Verrucomicrobiales bacterium]